MTGTLDNFAAGFGSDVIAETLRDLGLRYIALNPGASYRGLHDSLVNFTQGDPEILLCIHEEAAVAIAHGWAKVSGQPMAVALHSNVGLMHGSMGIFNAFCDRVPMVVLGATGPVDAARRRPWIEWIHTSQDQGALVRDFVKWDDQPASVEAARDALIQGAQVAATAPRGPVYINLDAELQEKALPAPLPAADLARRRAPRAAAPDPSLVDEAAALLSAAERPVMLCGRMSRAQADWDRRIALAERLGARVITDFKTGSTFPSTHPAIVGAAGYFPDAAAKAAISEADAILNLDWVDFGGLLRSIFGPEPVPARIISASLDSFAQRGWSKDGGAPFAADVALLNEPDQVVAALLGRLGAPKARQQITAPAPGNPAPDGPLNPQAVALVLRHSLAGRDSCLIRGPLSWSGEDWPMLHPLASLGYDGGGGIGSGPGMAVGGALALRDAGSPLLPLAVLGDGDFLMNASALWTAVAAKIPLMVIVQNNRSFYNDEVHQDTVARQRGRPPENRHVGIAMTGPDIDISAISRGFGCWSPGLLSSPEAIVSAVGEGLRVVDAGGVAVLEIETAKGYSPAMATALRSGN